MVWRRLLRSALFSGSWGDRVNAPATNTSDLGMDTIAEQGMPLRNTMLLLKNRFYQPPLAITKGEKDMNGDYGALRLWSTVLMFIGILGVIFVLIGVIFAVLGANSFWQVLTILLIGGPLAALFASWPIALGQALRALADVAEYVRDQQQGVRAERLSEGEQVPRD